MTRRDRSCRAAIRAGVVAIVVAAGVAGWGSPRVIMAFAGPALAAWLIAAAELWRRRIVAPAEASLGLPTGLTLARGLLCSLVAGFTLLPPRGVTAWVPALLYGTAALADRADGALARRRQQVTRLGADLDGAIDALGLLAAPLCAVAWGRLPPWYLALGSAYYVYEGALAVRQRLRLPTFPERLRRRPLTRIFAGLQMTLVAIALAPIAPAMVITPLATALMLPSLAFFARDWLVVVGRWPEIAALRNGAAGPADR